ncbi:MAG: carbohydrate ABC transporter permease [Clostridiaceae bacterium]
MNRNIGIGRRIFVIVNYIFCISVAIVCILPVMHLLAVSLSSKNEVVSGRVAFWPVAFTLDSYRYVLQDAQYFLSFFMSIKRAALGWFVQMVMTVLAAYPLSLRKNVFPARQIFIWYFVVTMFFSGGLVPNYLVVESTGINDTIWALVLPSAVPIFNIILMKNFIKELPDSLMESAFIDGANHFTTLFRIVIPLCKAAIATISLFSILYHWNAWFDGMIYIKNMALKPLQTYLRSVIIADSSVSDESEALEEIMKNISPDSVSGAKIFFALIPIMCIYPFLQKYFTKGIVMGSVKG